MIRPLKTFGRMTAWIVLTPAAIFATWRYGIAGGLAVAALSLAICAKPDVLHLSAPSSDDFLKIYSWFLGLPGFLVFVTAYIWIAKYLFADVSRIGIKTVMFFMAVLFVLFFLLFMPLASWSIERVVIGGKIKTSYWEIHTLDTSTTEFLWLPDGKSLLIAQSDEDRWFLYVHDAKNNKRKMTFKHDWRWLEELWERHGLDEHSFLSSDPWNIDESQQVLPDDFDDRLRRFFLRLIPRCDGFPSFEVNLSRRYEKWGKIAEARRGYLRALDLIPPESRFFRQTAEIARQALEHRVNTAA